MAFYGSYFTFDGVSCRNYNLMIYDFGPSSQDDTVAFGSTGTAIEDRTANRYASFFYGVKQDTPLTFNLTFGADCCVLDKRKPFRRPEVAQIASWLTGHNTWKWLEIEQPDMDLVQYKCYISDLRLITYSGEAWAFKCTITCDSPYAYLREQRLFYAVNGSLTVDIENPGSYHGRYYPYVIIDTTDSTDISLTNITDHNRITSFAYPATSVHIPSGKRFCIDNENQIITVSAFNSITGEYETDTSINPYALFNHCFFGLVQGTNTIAFSGYFEIEIITAFPVDVGA